MLWLHCPNYRLPLPATQLIHTFPQLHLEIFCMLQIHLHNLNFAVSVSELTLWFIRTFLCCNLINSIAMHVTKSKKLHNYMLQQAAFCMSYFSGLHTSFDIHIYDNIWGGCNISYKASIIYYSRSVQMLPDPYSRTTYNQCLCISRINMCISLSERNHLRLLL